MPDLLREGERPPRFALQSVAKRTIALDAFLSKRRIVLLFLAPGPPAGDNGRAWLETASKAGEALAERDVIVLVIAAPGEARGATKLPAPFVVLRDEKGEVAQRFGNAPAFYLIGKDGGIKRASRTCPPLSVLLGQIDAMPMRQEEMRRKTAS